MNSLDGILVLQQCSCAWRKGWSSKICWEKSITSLDLACLLLSLIQEKESLTITPLQSFIQEVDALASLIFNRVNTHTHNTIQRQEFVIRLISVHDGKPPYMLLIKTCSFTIPISDYISPFPPTVIFLPSRVEKKIPEINFHPVDRFFNSSCQ